MNAYALSSYRSLQCRRIAARRARALFLTRTTQHVSSDPSLLAEMARAGLALSAVAAWGAAIVLLAS
jgi:hypothetical protein